MNENTTNSEWLQAVSDRALLVSPGHVPQFLAGLNAVSTFIKTLEAPPDEGGDSSDAAPSVNDDDKFWTGWRAWYRPYEVSDGILTIPVYGSLLDKFSMQFGSWATGYEYIQKAFERGMSDAGVRSILLDIDSPGGHGAGNFELVDYMAEIGDAKPVHAVANGLALSGGYSIASVADSLMVRPSGSTGSVGVIAVHFDMSEMLANEGIKPTVIRSGKYKAEGNMLEPLSEHARERFQEESDRMYGTFVATVAKNRGISEDSVRETEAQVYGAEDSVAIGFADRVGEIRHQRARMLAPGNEGAQMADDAGGTGNDGGQGGEGEGTVTQQDVTAAQSKAQTEERKRFAAVLASDEYAGREELAQKLLAETGMDSGAIISMLKSAPKAEGGGDDAGGGEGQGRNHFQEHMDRNGGADAGGGEPAGDTSDHRLWPNRPKGSVSILSDYRAAGGRTNDDVQRRQREESR